MKKYNIYYRRDGRFEGRVSRGKDKDGRRLFSYFFGHTREEVEQKIDASRKSGQNNCCATTVGQLFTEWFQNIRFRIKESTAANYLMKAEKHIIPEFSDINASEIDESDICRFIESRQKKGLSNRYISDIIIMLKSIFRYASNKYQFCNPLDSISLPKSKKNEVMLLNNDEQQKLQHYIVKNQNTTTLGIALAMSTGIRIGELCALQWCDIDLEKRILTVKKTIQRIKAINGQSKTKLIITEPKSESSKRKIPIPECIMPILEKFKGNNNEYLISEAINPTEPRTLQYRFASILKNADLPSVHFHSLRHMFATKCMKLGFDVKSLSEILGHSSVEVTLNRYVHSDFDQKRQFMERISLNF